MVQACASVMGVDRVSGMHACHHGAWAQSGDARGVRHQQCTGGGGAGDRIVYQAYVSVAECDIDMCACYGDGSSIRHMCLS